MSLAADISPARLVVETATRMLTSGLTVSSLGNVSVRAGAHVWITPTRVAASELRPEDVVVLGLDASRPQGGEPSIESPLHLALYERHPWARAVVHTHSPWATAWSHLGRDLALPTEELRYHGLARVRCSRAAPAGSVALAEAAAEAMEGSSAALLREHGAIAMAESPTRALDLCAVVEQQAHVHWLLRLEALHASA